MKGYNRQIAIIMGFLLALLIMTTMTGTAKEMIENTQEASEGCSMIASILADMFEGMGLC